LVLAAADFFSTGFGVAHQISLRFWQSWFLFCANLVLAAADFFSTGFGATHQISLCPVLLLGAHSDPAARRAPMLSPCSSFSVRSHRLYQVSVPCKSSPGLGRPLLDWFSYSVAASSSCFVSPIVASSWRFHSARSDFVCCGCLTDFQ
jgi:hypothetical protein